MLSGVCRRLSSSVTRIHGGPAGGFTRACKAMTSCRHQSNYSSTITLHGGPVVLRLFLSNPQFDAVYKDDTGYITQLKTFHTCYRAFGPELNPVYSPQVSISHPPGGRLPLLSARPAVTFPAAQHHRHSAGTKLYCLVTEAHRCEQLTKGSYAALPREVF